MDTCLENVLKLIRLTMDPSCTDRPDLSNWTEIKKELEMQTILPFVSEAALTCNLNENQQNEVITAMGANIQHFYAYMAEQDQLIKLLEANNIPCAIMKGAAAAQYYPKPDLRAMGDIDILVLPEDFEKAFHLLRESGYSHENFVKFDQRHIIFSSEKGQAIELHRYFSCSNNNKQNDLLDAWLYGELENVQKVDCLGYKVPVFGDKENGLILLSHINHHLSGGLALRQIIDWLAFAQNVLDDQLWDDWFYERAKAIGMDKLAITVTKMCQKYLGLCQDITWCKHADDFLVEGLITYLIVADDFGDNDAHWSKKTKEITHSFSNPTDAIKYLTTIGMVHMHEAGLKPRKSIAWLYQIRHLIQMSFTHKDQINFRDNIRSGKEERDFLKELGVTKL